MCDCQDENNINSIPVGPQGPTGPAGPAGPAPVLNATSTGTVTVAVGLTDFPLVADAGFSVGQRVSAINDLGTKEMYGIVDAYSTVTDILTIDVQTVVGSGSDNAWNINLVGERGATGATGAAGAAGATGATGATGQSAKSTMSVGVNSGVDLYTLTVANSDWLAVGQTVFIQTAGYYTVSSIPTSTEIIVYNIGATGNVPGNLVGGGLNLRVTSAGLTGAAGTNGTDGFNYETTDGNNIPAEATAGYQFLMRNPDDTGYTWTSLADLKVLLASIP